MRHLPMMLKVMSLNIQDLGPPANYRLQFNASVACSANREQQQTDSQGGNQCVAHAGIMFPDQTGLAVAELFSRLSLLTDSKSWSAAAAHS